MRGLDAVAERLAEEVVSVRRKLGSSEAAANELRAELEDAKARSEEDLRTLAVLARQFEELRAGARGAATQIRLAALREAAEVNARLLDAGDPRLSAAGDRVYAALEAAIDRVAGESETEPPAPPLSRSAQARVAWAAGQVSGAPRRHVSVDIGPFDDFSQLVRFEDAANAIGATGDISIRRFSEGRAEIEVALNEPVDFLRELEENSDLEFEVRSSSDGELILDV